MRCAGTTPSGWGQLSKTKTGSNTEEAPAAKATERGPAMSTMATRSPGVPSKSVARARPCRYASFIAGVWMGTSTSFSSLGVVVFPGMRILGTPITDWNSVGT